jgi:hypothetical protein
MRVLPVFLTAISFTLLGCGGESPAQRSPKTFTISNGDSVTYKPGVARPGDKIVCLGGCVVIGKPGTGVLVPRDRPGSLGGRERQYRGGRIGCSELQDLVTRFDRNR